MREVKCTLTSEPQRGGSVVTINSQWCSPTSVHQACSWHAIPSRMYLVLLPLVESKAGVRYCPPDWPTRRRRPVGDAATGRWCSGNPHRLPRFPALLQTPGKPKLEEAGWLKKKKTKVRSVNVCASRTRVQRENSPFTIRPHGTHLSFVFQIMDVCFLQWHTITTRGTWRC